MLLHLPKTVPIKITPVVITLRFPQAFKNNHSKSSTAVQMEHTCGSLVLHKSHPINLSYLLTLVSHELHSNFLLALNQL